MKLVVGWLLFITILFLLPGSALPQETWLTKISFDKIVHIVFFTVLVWLLCRSYYKSGKPATTLKWLFAIVAIIAILYGVAIEFMQKYLVANRSFDFGDIIADSTGAALGGIISYGVYLKRTKPS